MNNKEINPIVGIAIGAVALVIVLVLGYKLFLSPAPLPPEPNYAATQYPGGHAAAAPAPATP